VGSMRARLAVAIWKAGAKSGKLCFHGGRELIQISNGLRQNVKCGHF